MVVRYFMEMLRSPVEVARNLYRYRHILLQMVVNEIKGRFAGSLGGLLWHFVHPLIMLVAYLFVFVYIFKLRVSSGAGAGASAVYIMAGLFPWIIMSEGLHRATSSLMENANLIQKTAFPTEILPAKGVIAPYLSFGVALLLLALYSVWTTGFPGIILLLPLVVLLQVCFTLGLALLSSTLTVFFRDMLQLVQVGVSFWIFLTPVFYPLSLLPEWAQKAMYLNPIYPFVAAYQSLFINGRITDWHLPLLAFCWAAAALFTGTFFFTKLKHEFADWL